MEEKASGIFMNTEITLTKKGFYLNSGKGGREGGGALKLRSCLYRLGCVKKIFFLNAAICYQLFFFFHKTIN